MKMMHLICDHGGGLGVCFVVNGNVSTGMQSDMTMFDVSSMSRMALRMNTLIS